MTADWRRNISALAETLRGNGVHLLLLLLLTGLTYGEVLTHTFLVSWDDPGYVTQNPAVTGFSLHNIVEALTTSVAGNYAPVPIISYMLDYTLWGMNPCGYFLANISYHFFSGVLLYALLIRHGFGKWFSTFGCAIFLVHPVQVESVAWVSQRKNLLAMLFYLLAFHAWLKHREQSAGAGYRWYVVSMVLFACSLLAKSVAVVFPLMLILHDLLVQPVHRRLREHIDKLPYLVAAGIIGVIAMNTQSIEKLGGRVDYPDDAVWVLLLTMLPVLVSYIRLLVWPDPSSLCAIYTVPTRNEVDWMVIQGCGVLICLIICAVYLFRRNRHMLFWYLLIFVGLLPVSQIIPLVTRMNDRYLYFPMLGVAGIIACFGAKPLRMSGKYVRKVFTAASVCLIVVLAAASHIRGRVWKDTITLFSDMVAKVPNQYVSWDGLAEGYRAAGDMETALKYYEMASKYGYLREIESYHLARIYLERGDYDTAYNHIWGLLLKSKKTGNKDGFLLLGEYYYLTGSYEDAERQLVTYLDAVPDSPEALFYLAKVYFMRGDRERAYRLIVQAKETGGENAELLYALDCLVTKKNCTSLEMTEEGSRGNGE